MAPIEIVEMCPHLRCVYCGHHLSSCRCESFVLSIEDNPLPVFSGFLRTWWNTSKAHADEMRTVAHDS